MTLRDSFVAQFGEEQADAIELAASDHQDLAPARGSDPFRWAFILCLGYGLFEDEKIREQYGITVQPNDIIIWGCSHEGYLSRHDGNTDMRAYRSLMSSKVKLFAISFVFYTYKGEDINIQHTLHWKYGSSPELAEIKTLETAKKDFPGYKLVSTQVMEINLNE